jgi:hypothetical protein
MILLFVTVFLIIYYHIYQRHLRSIHYLFVLFAVDLDDLVSDKPSRNR